MTELMDVSGASSSSRKESLADGIKKSSEDDDVVLYCICRTTETETFMICCDKCEEWFHGKCIKVTQEHAKNIQKYFCTTCTDQHPNLSIVYKKKYLKELEKQKVDDQIATSSGPIERAPSQSQGPARCGRCIGCFRTEPCDTCSSCVGGRRDRCLKQQCVQADLLSGSATPSGTKSPVRSSPEKSRRGRKKGWRKERHQSKDKSPDVEEPMYMTASTSTKVLPKAQDAPLATMEDPIIVVAREVMKAAYETYSERRRGGGGGGRRTKGEDRPPPRQCLGPSCTKVQAAREESKYCSNDCGRKLAELRLRTILPQRVEDFFKHVPKAGLRQAVQLRELEDRIRQLQTNAQTLVDYQALIERYVHAIKGIVPMPKEANDVATDYLLSCTVCGVECSSKQLAKHVERCFVRQEKQITFGTNEKAPHNPNGLFCEAYNKVNKTYCMRLRVMCPDHYKDEAVSQLKVCGCPKSWTDLDSKTLEEIFLAPNQLINDNCLEPLKDCSKHHRWHQTALGILESERLTILTRIGELCERMRQLNESEQLRGHVISLLCNSTTVIKSPPNSENGHVSDGQPVDGQ